MFYTALVDSHSLPHKTSKSGPELVRCQVFTWKCALRCNSLHIFFTSQLPEMVRDHWLLTLLSWTCAPQLPEVVLGCQAFTLWTSKCASRHSGVHFLDISNSKSCPRMVCSANFDLDMFFAPQRRALFRHRNIQKRSDLRCFAHFALHMCFAPQRHAIFHLLSDQLAPHLPL